MMHMKSKIIFNQTNIYKNTIKECKLQCNIFLISNTNYVFISNQKCISKTNGLIELKPIPNTIKKIKQMFHQPIIPCLPPRANKLASQTSFLY